MLDALPKILEGAMKMAFEPLLRESYKKYDALNMAYRENCGVELCISTALSEVERSNEPSVQFFGDLQKAFQYCHRGLILKRFQQICGAGQIVHSWFERRWYIFDGATRGWQFNRGVPAGTLIGVISFLMHADSNIAMSALNPDILGKAVSSFSDDDSPLFSETTTINGGTQRTLTDSYEYMSSLGCKYHVDGLKGPTLLVYLKKTEIYREDLYSSLTLGGYPVKSVSKQRFLGVVIEVRNNSVLEKQETLLDLEESFEIDHATNPIDKRLIGSKRYIIHWPIAKIKALAYRIQQTEQNFIPHDIRATVMSYVSGVIRFAVAQKWLRGDPEQLKSINFFYGMAMAAICGLNACEVFGLASCKAEKLSTDSVQFHKLLELTGLPTIEDMAINGARVVTFQSASLFPERFVYNELNRHRGKQYHPKLPRATIKAYEKTLAGDLCKLALKKRDNEELPKQRRPTEEEKKMIKLGKMSEADLPYVKTRIPKKAEFISRTWNFCSETFSEKNHCVQRKELFTSFCKLHFEVFDEQDKRRKFRTPTNRLIPACKLMPPGHVFSSSETLDLCLLCGEKWDEKVSVNKCINCFRLVHSECAEILYRFGTVKNWSLNGLPENFECSQVDISFSVEHRKKLLEKNCTSTLAKSLLTVPTVRKKNSRIFSNAFVICKFCGESISLDTHNHKLSCSAIATPVTPKTKKMKLTDFDPTKADSLEKMRRTGRFLKKYVEKSYVASIERNAENRRRCDRVDPD